MFPDTRRNETNIQKEAEMKDNESLGNVHHVQTTAILLFPQLGSPKRFLDSVRQ